jgi:peptidoglycan/xylan/chitin deacetylase (PgdA/CDA1 family)
MMSPGASGLAFSGVLSLSARASDDTGVSGVVFFVDDTAFGSGSTGTGSSDVFTLLLDSTSLANGEHSVYSTAYDAAGNSGSTERRLLRIENPVPDTVAPTVSIVSPTAGSILSGTGTLSITASDDVGIVSVRYSITNGQNLTIGRFDEPPYVVTIPADALKNGSHTITAYAEDAAGNIGNASPVRYNTYYVPPEPQNPNLIANPSLETGNGGIPDAWTKGGWGNNVASFSYPVTGTDGQYAAEISMSEWTNGDAKWYFSDVPVTGGANYSFSDWYKSTVPSELTIRYAYADGSYSYAAIVSRLPASADWINAVQTLTVPPNAVKATVFHLISGVGTLTIDQAEFRLASAGGTPGPNSFPTGLVSFSFDDGWASQYDNAVPALDAAGIRGSFYIITDEMGAATNPNRLSNPSFEIADSASLPASWSGHAEGGATATFSYPVSGIASGKAAKVEMNSYSGGTAGWQSDPVTAANGESYNFSDRYLSDVPTQVTVEYAMSDSTVRERILGTVPASGIWADARFSFVVPANVRRLSVRHCLASAGTLVTDEYRLGLSRNYMDLDQLQSIQRAGHEIGSHSKTHPFLTGLSEADASDEIS